MAVFNHVSIHHYRADNGYFANNKFQKAYIACNQTIDFCNIGIHFQNRIAETNIGFLQSLTRLILLHAIHLWPEMIALELWILALLEATRISNLTHFDSNGRAPIAIFSGSDALLDLSKEHMFSCPVFVLDDSLQNRKKIPKLDSCIFMGIYIRKSPFYAGSVNLIMNKDTSLISSQFHCVFDNNFTIVLSLQHRVYPPNWNDLAKSSTAFISKENFLKTNEWLLDHAPPVPPVPPLLGFGIPDDSVNLSSTIPNMTWRANMYIQLLSDLITIQPIQSVPLLPIEIQPTLSSTILSIESINPSFPVLSPILRRTPSAISMPLLDKFPYKSCFDVHDNSNSLYFPDYIYTLPDEISASRVETQLFNHPNQSLDIIPESCNESETSKITPIPL